MGSKRCMVFGVGILAMMLFGPSIGFAQTAGTGALTGTVTDTSGSAIPNVVITATNAETGQVRAAHTDTSGAYSLSHIDLLISSRIS